MRTKVEQTTVAFAIVVHLRTRYSPETITTIHESYKQATDSELFVLVNGKYEKRDNSSSEGNHKRQKL